jgi:hypothetical protein
MARPIPHPGSNPDPRLLHDWAIKLTQGLRERFAPQDTIPEVVPVAPDASLPIGAGVLWGSLTAVPADFVLAGALLVRADYPDLFTLWGTSYNTGGETGLEFRAPAVSSISGTGSTVIFKALNL